ncbi:hypothetical protein AK812_SmicGene10809 [Symbiodinium microadriaticum]|uniref:Uncharacterized protein n=1 Tax=Symbiodinium microadriaticum TaxID=2951 RepID=A0A1Q9EEX4_SYMMI|nr:hypothetical protein AK812_SmicGene10809 [Symbiodinium microadriaticum]
MVDVWGTRDGKLVPMLADSQLQVNQGPGPADTWRSRLFYACHTCSSNLGVVGLAAHEASLGLALLRTAAIAAFTGVGTEDRLRLDLVVYGWSRARRPSAKQRPQASRQAPETSDGALMDAVCRFTTPPPEPLDWHGRAAVVAVTPARLEYIVNEGRCHQASPGVDVLGPGVWCGGDSEPATCGVALGVPIGHAEYIQSTQDARLEEKCRLMKNCSLICKVRGCWRFPAPAHVRNGCCMGTVLTHSATYAAGHDAGDGLLTEGWGEYPEAPLLPVAADMANRRLRPEWAAGWAREWVRVP